MNSTSREALQKSIQHWQRMAYPQEGWPITDQPVGWQCALCNEHDDCIGCPVAITTGHTQCHRTPYYHAREAFESLPIGQETGNEFRAQAKKELAFLESLLFGYSHSV